MHAHHIKDSFWSTAYRGGYIQGCHNRTLNREEVRVVFADGTSKEARSVRAARMMLNAASAPMPERTSCN